MRTDLIPVAQRAVDRQGHDLTDQVGGGDQRVKRITDLEFALNHRTGITGLALETMVESGAVKSSARSAPITVNVLCWVFRVGVRIAVTGELQSVSSVPARGSVSASVILTPIRPPLDCQSRSFTHIGYLARLTPMRCFSRGG